MYIVCVEHSFNKLSCEREQKDRIEAERRYGGIEDSVFKMGETKSS